MKKLIVFLLIFIPAAVFAVDGNFTRVKVGSGGIISSGTITGNGGGLTNIPASAVTGTLISTASLSARTLNGVLNDVSPEFFGAVGDGITDDSAAFVLALYSASSSSGKIALSAGKTYIVKNVAPRSNVTIEGNGATLSTGGEPHAAIFTDTNSAATGTWAGQTINNPFFNPTENSYTGGNLTYYALNTALSYSVGQTTIYLNSAGDATHFNAGDYVWVRCRGLHPESEFIFAETPVAELNIISSVSGTALNLTYPLSKDYQYDPGTYSGWVPVYGVANANSLVIHDFHIKNTKMVASHYRPLSLLNVFNISVEDSTLEGIGAAHTRGRFQSILNNTIHTYPDRANYAWQPYYWAWDTGSSDIAFQNNNCASSGYGWLHILEGVANVKVTHNSFMQPEVDNTGGVADTVPVIWVTLLSWNVTIQGNTILNSPSDGFITSTGEPYGEGNKFIHITDNNLIGVGHGDCLRHTSKTNDYEAIISGNILYSTCTPSYQLNLGGSGAILSNNWFLSGGSTQITSGNTLNGNTGLDNASSAGDARIATSNSQVMYAVRQTNDTTDRIGLRGDGIISGSSGSAADDVYYGRLQAGLSGTTLGGWYSSGGYSELKTNITISSGAVTFVHGFNDLVLTGAVTAITMPTPYSYGGQAEEVTVQITQAAGLYAVSGWPASVMPPSGLYTAPTTSGGVDLLKFKYNQRTGKWNPIGYQSTIDRGLSTSGTVTATNYAGITANMVSGGSGTNAPTRLICSTHLQSAITGTTGETTLYTCTVPANSIGIDGTLKVDPVAISFTNSTNAKTLRIKFGGATLFSFAYNTAGWVSALAYAAIHNRHSATVQVWTLGQVNHGWGGSGSAIQTATIDTTGDRTLTVTCQLATAGESCALEAIDIYIQKP